MIKSTQKSPKQRCGHNETISTPKIVFKNVRGWGDGSVGKYLRHVSTKSQISTGLCKLDEVVHVYNPKDPRQDGRQWQENPITSLLYTVLNNKRNYLKQGKKQGPTSEVVLCAPHMIRSMWAPTHTGTSTHTHTHTQAHTSKGKNTSQIGRAACL